MQGTAETQPGQLKKGWVIVLILNVLVAGAQGREQQVQETVKSFHRALVDGNLEKLGEMTDNMLHYGHSNGWVESRNEFLRNLETGYMKYQGFSEDSLQVWTGKKTAQARFVADIRVTMNGKEGNYHLKVLEVWVRKGKKWFLFARQAVR